jgi:hypothetical protein
MSIGIWLRKLSIIKSAKARKWREGFGWGLLVDPPLPLTKREGDVSSDGSPRVVAERQPGAGGHWPVGASELGAPGTDISQKIGDGRAAARPYHRPSLACRPLSAYGAVKFLARSPKSLMWRKRLVKAWNRVHWK